MIINEPLVVNNECYFSVPPKIVSGGAVVGSVLNGQTSTAAAAAPTTGTWALGDRCWNTAPAASGTPGWVCVVAGTPGTWKAMANLAA